MFELLRFESRVYGPRNITVQTGCMITNPVSGPDVGDEGCTKTASCVETGSRVRHLKHSFVPIYRSNISSIISHKLFHIMSTVRSGFWWIMKPIHSSKRRRIEKQKTQVSIFTKLDGSLSAILYFKGDLQIQVFKNILTSRLDHCASMRMSFDARSTV